MGSDATAAACPWGIFAGLAAFALTVAISPAVASKTFTPKFAVTLLLGGAGLVPLVTSVRAQSRRERLAFYGAGGFLVVALVSALISQAPNIGIFGLYGWGTGWLLWLGSAGAFAIGYRLDAVGRRWLFGGLVTGAIANSLLALYQTLAVPANSTFGPYQGNQADGFLGNPVFLESLLLGAIAIVSVRAAKTEVRSLEFGGWMAALALMSVALEFSDERAAVGLMAILVAGLVLVYRLKGLVVAVPAVVGYLVGYLSAGSSLGTRIAEGTSSVGFHQRLDLWRFAASALLHRPLLGFGPGELESATNPRMSLGFARTLQPGKLFADSHNLVIEVAVTTGILGLACFIAWVVPALLGARNLFVYFALMCFAVELVEPLNIAITPLAFLALGASVMPRSLPHPHSRRLAGPARACVAVLCAAAVLLGGEMIVGDAAFVRTPPRDYLLANSKTANSLLFYWPESSAALTEYYRYEAAVHHTRRAVRHYLELALQFSRETADRLPFDPLVWVSLGDSELALRRFSSATREYERALRADRWSAAAFDGLGQVSMEQHRFAAAERWYRRELQAAPPGPEQVAAAAHLRDARRGIVPQTGL